MKFSCGDGSAGDVVMALIRANERVVIAHEVSGWALGLPDWSGWLALVTLPGHERAW